MMNMRIVEIQKKRSAGFLSILLLLLFYLPSFGSNMLSIEEAQQKGIIDLQIRALGGYTGYCVEIKMSNRSAEDQKIKIEAGRRLISENESKQDILIVKEMIVWLPVNAKDSVAVYGFCCQSANKSPFKGDLFNVGYMASDDLIELAKFIDENKFDDVEINMAVWTLSDNHHPASVCSAKNSNSKLLLGKIAEIKKIDMPWYCIRYAADDSLLFSHDHEYLSGTFEFSVKHYSTVSIQIRTKSGRLIKVLSDDAIYDAGEYVYHLNQKVKKWPKGEYEILIFEDRSNLISKTGFYL
jgi:hypothetical protein